MFELESKIVSFHRASSEDHSAFTSDLLYSIFCSRLFSLTVSFKYFIIEGPSAIALRSLHGLKEKPNVNISESDLIPGYLNKSHVPPIESLFSNIVKFLFGHFFLK